MVPTFRSLWLVPIVFVLALGEVAAHYVCKDRAPTLSDWQRLSERVKALHAGGDLIVVAPAWGEPLARHVLGDQVMPLSVVARADEAAFARAVEVDFMGQESSALSTWREIHRERSGPFTLRLRENLAQEKPRYWFIDHVDENSLTVAVRRRRGDQICPFNPARQQFSGGLAGDPPAPRARFECGSGTLNWVGVTIIEDEQYRPHRCIWAPHHPDGALVLRFRNVPLGSRLVGHAGSPWLTVRDGAGPPILVSAQANQVDFAARQIADTQGFVRFNWDTKALENTTADVDVIISGTPGNAQRFCFTLEAR